MTAWWRRCWPPTNSRPRMTKPPLRRVTWCAIGMRSIPINGCAKMWSTPARRSSDSPSTAPIATTINTTRSRRRIISVSAPSSSRSTSGRIAGSARPTPASFRITITACSARCSASARCACLIKRRMRKRGSILAVTNATGRPIARPFRPRCRSFSVASHCKFRPLPCLPWRIIPACEQKFRKWNAIRAAPTSPRRRPNSPRFTKPTLLPPPRNATRSRRRKPASTRRWPRPPSPASPPRSPANSRSFSMPRPAGAS